VVDLIWSAIFGNGKRTKVGADAVRCFVIGRICETGWRGNGEITQHPWTKMVTGQGVVMWVDCRFGFAAARTANNALRAERLVVKYLEIG
jgi:hypothetical protein